MGKFSGVFPVYGINLEINTSGDTAGDAGTWVTIADMETASLSIETGVETWNSITEDGWQRALATAKSFTLSMNGKRCIGDPGNDYIASKAFANGRDCDSRVRVTFPDGAKFEGGVVISVTEMLGDAVNVSPLGFDLASNGKPTYTPAAA